MEASDEPQKAQDMLAALEQQRNAACNQWVHAAAENAALKRKIADLEKQLSGEDKHYLEIVKGD